jgi:SAM-dependent methyltransferase
MRISAGYSVIFANFSISRHIGRCIVEVIDKYTRKKIGNALLIDTDIFNDDEQVPASLRGRSNRADLPNFFFTGYDDCAKLVRAMETMLGPAAAPRAVLDWGVGSGRVSRFMKKDQSVTAYGCDIDPVNMSSLHERGFDVSRFKLMAPGGPIPFPDHSFDFCFGLSVFTHLTEELQDFYLAELVRVLKPGGAAVFSIHGPLHFFSQINDGKLFGELMSKGIVVVSESPVLDKGFPEAKEKNLYVNTLHSYPYVLEHWSKFFKHVIISDALSVTLHDYVLCRT